MPKIKITNTFVNKVKCPDDKIKIDYFDIEDIGFMLEVRKSGNKTYYCRYNDNGKTKLQKISDVKLITANKARQIAQTLLSDIKLNDNSLLKELDSKKQSSCITLDNFYNQYYLPYIKQHIKSYKSNDSTYKMHIRPIFKNTPMNNINKLDIIKAHNDMISKKRLKPSTANKFIIFLSSIFHLALDMQLKDIIDNPVKGIKPFVENNHKERFLTKDESKRLIQSVNQSQNPNLKFIVPFLILTGARRGEVLNAKWKDIDVNNMMWTIPTSKSGKKRYIPISNELHKLILSIPKTSKEYLFPSPKTNLPQNDVYQAWNNARIKANLKDVRMHDLRHSFASQLVNSGRSLYEVQILLGHSNMKMTQRYAHLSNESLMSAVSCAGNLMKWDDEKVEEGEKGLQILDKLDKEL